MTLEHIVPLSEYVPTIYKDCKEMDELVKTEDSVFQIAKSAGIQEYNRFYIQTSDEEGVRRFEEVYKITANPLTETLAFRKERLLTRSDSTLPYSTIWLRNYLNAVLGQGNYELVIDYEDLIIRLYGQILDYNWIQEVNQTITEAKPCNMIFINIPTIINSVAFQIWNDNDTWGSNVWNDTKVWSDFKILTHEESKYYTKETDDVNLQTLKTEVVGAIINNSQTITQLEKVITNHTLYVNFEPPSGVSTITNIKLINNLGNTIIEVDALIGVTSGTEIEVRLTSWKKRVN